MADNRGEAIKSERWKVIYDSIGIIVKSDVQDPLVSGPFRIAKGLFNTRFDVEEGTVAILLLNGKCLWVLQPGLAQPRGMKFYQGLKQYVVDMQDRILPIEVNGELKVMHPDTFNRRQPHEISLSLNLTYRVCDPEIVATRLKSPLGTLFDKVKEALGRVVPTLDYSDLAVGGPGQARIFNAIHDLKLEGYIGIEPLDVVITSPALSQPIETFIRHTIEGSLNQQIALDGVASTAQVIAARNVHAREQKRLDTVANAENNGIIATTAIGHGHLINHPELLLKVLMDESGRVHDLTGVLKAAAEAGVISPASFDRFADRVLPQVTPTGLPEHEDKLDEAVSHTEIGPTKDIPADDPTLMCMRELLKAATSYGATLITLPGSGNDVSFVVNLEAKKILVTFKHLADYPNSRPGIEITKNGKNLSFWPNSPRTADGSGMLTALLDEAIAFATQ